MVSYNEALLATPASRVVNPYIQGTDIMDTGVPYRRERGFSAPPPTNSAAAENDHQRAEMAPRLPPLREIFRDIYDGNKTDVAEVADMGPFGTAGREQRPVSDSPRYFVFISVKFTPSPCLCSPLLTA